MRLIDADALKERAIRVSTVKGLGNKEHCYIKAVGTHEIDKAPTIDAVPVVRCRDCMWFDTEDELADVFRQERHCYCTEVNTYVSENGFCYCGERKENDNA